MSNRLWKQIRYLSMTSQLLPMSQHHSNWWVSDRHCIIVLLALCEFFIRHYVIRINSLPCIAYLWWDKFSFSCDVSYIIDTSPNSKETICFLCKNRGHIKASIPPTNCISYGFGFRLDEYTVRPEASISTRKFDSYTQRRAQSKSLFVTTTLCVTCIDLIFALYICSTQTDSQSSWAVFGQQQSPHQQPAGKRLHIQDFNILISCIAI